MPPRAAARAAMPWRAWRTEVLPEPFGPSSSVNGASGSVVWRNALKLVNVIASIIVFSRAIGRPTGPGAAKALIIPGADGQGTFLAFTEGAAGHGAGRVRPS